MAHVVVIRVLLCAAALYGLLLVVDGVAYVLGAGPDVDIHVISQTFDGDPSGGTVPVSRGVYLDAAGEPHDVELLGAEVGDTVRTRLPLLGREIVLVSLDGRQNLVGLGLGLLLAFGSSSLAKDH